MLCLELEEEKEQELDFGMEDRRDNSSLLKSSELTGGKKKTLVTGAGTKTQTWR